jgi:hypothetical protein
LGHLFRRARKISFFFGPREFSFAGGLTAAFLFLMVGFGFSVAGLLATVFLAGLTSEESDLSFCPKNVVNERRILPSARRTAGASVLALALTLNGWARRGRASI